MENKNDNVQKSTVKIVLSIIFKTIITAVALFFIYLIGSLVSLLLISEDIHLPIIYIGVYGVPALALILLWLKKKKKVLIGWLLLAAVYLVVLGIDFGVIKHRQSIQIDTSSYLNIYESISDYYPFEEGSKIVDIDSKTLKLTDNLPVVGVETGLYPMASAFVNAVYPETIDPLYEYFNSSNQGAFEYLAEWGYKDLVVKEEGTYKADIFIDFYPNKDGESFVKDSGTTLKYTTIGTEALVFFVHKDNPIDSITIEQAKDIYSGKITNWQDIGGKKGKIKAYQCDTGSAPQKLMEHFMGDTTLMAAPTEKGYSNLYRLIDVVSKYRNQKNSIGFSYRQNIVNNPNVKILKIDGVEPTSENVKNGSYKIVTPIYTVTRENDANENITKFVDWMLTEEGQQIIEKSGYFAALPNLILE